MSQRFIHVANFDRQQHYKFRNPPWIKLYKAQFASREFRALSLEHQAIYGHLQILASIYENKIPFELDWLKAKIGFPPGRRLNLEPLIKSHFITVSNGRMPLADPSELWSYLLEFFNKWHTEFGWHYDAPPFDERLSKPLGAIGGWARIAQLDTARDIAAARREFIEYFKGGRK